MGARRILLVLLSLLVVVLAGAAIYIGIRLQQQSTAPEEAAAACSPGTIECRRDNPAICSSLYSANPTYNSMVGRYCNGVCTDTNFFDACAPHVINGSSCTGNYVDSPNTRIIRLSDGEKSRGSFIGCDASNQGNNCFCGPPGGFSVTPRGSSFSSGTITCLPDILDGSGRPDSCGARSTSTGPTPTPVTPTPITPTPGQQYYCCASGANQCVAWLNGIRPSNCVGGDYTVSNCSNTCYVPTPTPPVVCPNYPDTQFWTNCPVEPRSEER